MRQLTMKKMKNKQQAVEILPNNVIMEIFCRLPPKVVCKFRCVSKQWKSLIDDYYISKVLSNQQPDLVALLVTKSYRCDGSLEGLHYTDNHKFLYSCFPNKDSRLCTPSDLRDCCNGLLLFLCDRVFQGYVNLIICNPSTKQYVQLPEPYYEKTIFDIALAFDPRITPHYKVIEFLNEKKNRCFSENCYCNIFSSKTWSWKMNFNFKFVETTKHSSTGRAALNIEDWKSVYFDKAVYKLCRGESLTRYLVKFPIDTDHDYDDHEGVASATVISLPTQAVPFYQPQCLGITNGNIVYACSDFGFQLHTSDSRLKIWVLKSNDVDNSKFEWVLKFSVSYQSIAGSQPMVSIYPCAFHPTDSNQIFLGCNVDGKYSNIYTYDLITQKLVDPPRRKLFSLNKIEDFGNFIVLPCVGCYSPLVRGETHYSLV